ncbi:MAG: hypothetical protein ACREER_02975 [Alphaproteobacteria bacterium]
MQQLVNKLRKLVDDAERARAADPRFLQDLHALVAEFDRPPVRPPLLSDDFHDGNFSAAPTWTVYAGQFSVDPQFGLRTIVPLPAAATGSNTGAILLQALLSNLANPQGTSSTARHATITAPLNLTNAFNIEFEFGSLVTGGQLAFGPSVPGDVYGGYRLVYVSTPRPSIKLVALRRGEQAIVAGRDLAAALEDRKRHTLTWKRKRNGGMTVNLDGTQIIQVTDQIFRESFAGITITNSGGDFVVRRVVVDTPG